MGTANSGRIERLAVALVSEILVALAPEIIHCCVTIAEVDSRADWSVYVLGRHGWLQF